MVKCPDYAFCDSSSLEDLEWVLSAELTLDPDKLLAFFDSGAARAFLEERTDRRFMVQASPRPFHGAVDADTASAEPCAVALFTLHSTSTDPTVRHGAVHTVLRGLSVNDEWQGLGLGHVLFQKVHSYAFDMAQLLVAAERLSGYNLPENPVFDFRIHGGCCFREPRALLVYHRNGATVTVGGRVVGEPQLRLWIQKTAEARRSSTSDTPATVPKLSSEPPPRQQIAYLAMDVDVIFPPLNLSAPYLSPTAFPGKGDVAQAFESMESTGAVAPTVYTRRTERLDTAPLSLITYNIQLRLGSLSIGGIAADAATGCYTFAIAAAPCSLLERYLRDPENTLLPKGNKRCPSLILERDAAGVPTHDIPGYNGYAATASTFNGESQLRRTRVATVIEQKDAVLKLPGCSALLAMAAAKLGWSFEFLKKPYLIHILLQDEDLQAGFDWHTDGEGTRVGKTREGRMVSLAIQLSSTAVSAMWVHGFRPCYYEGRGSCVLFHGGCLHRSLPWAPHVFQRDPNCSVIKIVFFYTDVPC